MQEFIATFHIDWKLMIAQIINFALVFLVFYLLAAKPLSKLMKDRREEIQTGLNSAKAGRELLQKAAEEYQENTIKLRKISIDAQKELQKDLEKLKEENVKRIKADTDEWVKNKTKQMEIDKKELIESAKGEITSIAEMIAEKVLNSKKDLNNL